VNDNIITIGERFMKNMRLTVACISILTLISLTIMAQEANGLAFRDAPAVPNYGNVTLMVDAKAGVTEELISYASTPEAAMMITVFGATTQGTVGTTNSASVVANLKLWKALNEATTGTVVAVAQTDTKVLSVLWGGGQHLGSGYQFDLLVAMKDKILANIPEGQCPEVQMAMWGGSGKLGGARNSPYTSVADCEAVLALMLQQVGIGCRIEQLRGVRNDMNANALLSYCTRWARKNGVKTVGVTIPQYQSIIDAQNTGVGLKAALEAVGLVYPAYWDAGIADAKARIAKILSGEQLAATVQDLARIEMFLGVEGLKKFVADYNNL
jgi:hypothetical protein